MSDGIFYFDFNINLNNVALWEFSSSPNLMGVLGLNQDWLDENNKKFWDEWLVDVFDLRTANDFGLSIWSVILQVPLYTQTDISPPSYPAFGFSPFGQNFFGSNFATSANPNLLSTEEKRKVLQLKYFKSVSNQNTFKSNKMLSNIFGFGQAYIIDNLDMTVTLHMSESISQVLREAVIELDVIPHTASVKIITATLQP